MLDTRLYRAAFAPALLAIIVAAFALGGRPRPIGTTLAPDAFDGRRAYTTLQELARTHPRTRPGSAGDEALATRVETELRRARFGVRTPTFEAETIDGDRTLRTVIGERPGLESRRIVVVAQRDTTLEGDAARLSGTAALIELAQLFRGRATRRTLTLVSTSGATGGMAGVRALVDELGGPVDAVLVLGDLAGGVRRRPFVVPYAESGGSAPMRLRRTVEAALREETELDPGRPRALVQLIRLAVPLTLTAQGPLGAAGLSAVTIQASGERGPGEDVRVSREGFESFGRGALRSISALDDGPDVPGGPREYLVVRRSVLPYWAFSIIVALLLLPAVVASVDGLARVRRRRGRIAPWLVWLATLAAPFALAALLTRLLGLVGVLPSLRGAVDPRALPPEPAAVGAVALLVVLGFLVRAPVGRAFGAPDGPRSPDAAGAAAAVAVALSALVTVIWALNPFTAALLVPALHVWLLVAASEVRLPRAVLVGAAAVALVPFAAVAAYYARQFGLGPLELAWGAVVVLAGGTAGPLGILGFSGLLACGIAAVIVAARKRAPTPPDDDDGAPDPDAAFRTSLGYRGPGSLGGTGSAVRR